MWPEFNPPPFACPPLPPNPCNGTTTELLAQKLYKDRLGSNKGAHSSMRQFSMLAKSVQESHAVQLQYCKPKTVICTEKKMLPLIWDIQCLYCRSSHCAKQHSKKLAATGLITFTEWLKYSGQDANAGKGSGGRIRL